MIERHIRFLVPSAKEVGFVDFIKHTYFLALHEHPGFVQAGLLQETEPPRRYLMTLTFIDSDRAAAWRSSERHKQLSPQLKTFHEGSEMIVLDVVLGKDGSAFAAMRSDWDTVSGELCRG